MNFVVPANKGVVVIPREAEITEKITQRHAEWEKHRVSLYVPTGEEDDDERIADSLLRDAAYTLTHEARLETHYDDHHAVAGMFYSLIPVAAKEHVERVFAERVVPVLAAAGWSVAQSNDVSYADHPDWFGLHRHLVQQQQEGDAKFSHYAIPTSTEVMAQLVEKHRAKEEACAYYPQEYDERNNERIAQALLTNIALEIHQDALLGCFVDFEQAFVDGGYPCRQLSSRTDTREVTRQIERVFSERVVPVCAAAGWDVSATPDHGFVNDADASGIIFVYRLCGQRHPK